MLRPYQANEIRRMLVRVQAKHSLARMLRPYQANEIRRMLVRVQAKHSPARMLRPDNPADGMRRP
jgi:hypothetical protein